MLSTGFEVARSLFSSYIGYFALSQEFVFEGAEGNVVYLIMK